MYINHKKLLTSITKNDIINICTSLGNGNHKEDAKGNLCFSTWLCHRGNSVNKLIYYQNENGGIFHCYTCGDSFDVIGLVIRCMRQSGKTYTFYKALQYIAQITGKKDLTSDVIDKPNTDIIDWSFASQFVNLKSTKREAPVLSAINENILEIFDYNPESLTEWINDGINKEALNRFEIGYYGYSNCLTIPHRNINGDLVGIRGRFLNERDVQEYGKYMPLQIDGKFLNHSLGNNLYGIHVSQEAIKRTGKVMLVEAEKSCLQAFTCYGDDSFVVATCGNRISLNQRKILLNTLKVSEIILAFDRDYKEPDSYEAERVYKLYVKKN